MEVLKDTFNVLYVDDEENNLNSFRAALRRSYNIYTASSGDEGMEVLSRNDIHVVVTDQRMPNMTGVQFLQHIPSDQDNIRIILTGFSDMESIIEAINTGKVYRYITKPWDKDELKITIDNAIETVMLRRNNKQLIQELQTYNEQLEEKVLERTKEIQKQKAIIEKAKAQSDSLLLNILPDEIAEELKKFGKSYARKHEQVSVLFADIKGFTAIAEILTPVKLVMQLDEVFGAFDNIIAKYGMEKIKTIGDAYMCASGLPQADNENAYKAVRAALDMQQFVKEFGSANKIQNLPVFEVRIGIHTGPLVAGVVGSKKFAYDIWGDAVNLASQMEQHGEPGKVNISADTFALVKDYFACTDRGKIVTKSKGDVEMYFVDEVKSA
ncbi:MAG: response regulator [Cyclobacteriaceae bacterium]|nr:response regulator [Cyclobacteriaceae bacterium]MDH4294776.1 response regulator [Cyclobacteriaceae bacterium]MDH5248625.1 response regulator [Cyclobacteriaceae bacterium]